MDTLAASALALEIILLLYVGAVDVATRLIPDEVSLSLAVLGIVSLIAHPTHVVESLAAATVLFLLLFVVHARGWMGGGDVKLLVAVAIGLPLAGVFQFLTITSYAGAGLAFAHVLLRRLPVTRPARRGASLLRRVYAVERWRNVRRAPLPFGAAIACGGICTVFSRGF